MTRSYHVVATPKTKLEPYFQTKHTVLDSFATYEDAVAFAKDRLLTLAPDVALEITHAGVYVWGPHFVNDHKDTP